MNNTIITKLIDSPSSDIEALLADLRDLLNTKRKEWRDIPSVNELTQSILTYGLPDFTLLDLSVKECSKVIEHYVIETINTHEPRLVNVKVISTTINHNEISFTISATMLNKPEPIAITFDSEFHPEQQQFAVSTTSDGR